MWIKLNCGVVQSGRAYDPKEVVFWKDKADAQRMIEHGVASPAPKPKDGVEE